MSDLRRSEIAAILSKALKRRQRSATKPVDTQVDEKPEEVLIVVDMTDTKDSEPEAVE